MARIGMVNYINTAPFYEVWKEQHLPGDWQVVEAPPSHLNRLLAADELDLGFVSCYEYCSRPEKYRIMADLSISATGPVGSVFLFSRYPLEDLSGKNILLTGQSDTSVYLLKIILEEFAAIRPASYTRGELFGDQTNLESFAAILAIGDEALRLDQQKAYPVQVDLAEYWHRQTGLPFVFSVCAVREAFLERSGAVAGKIHRTLLSCLEQGLSRLPEICERVARRIPMDCESCSRYLHSLEYDLGPEKQKALAHFFTYLIRRGEADGQSLPLKIFHS